MMHLLADSFCEVRCLDMDCPLERADRSRDSCNGMIIGLLQKVGEA